MKRKPYISPHSDQTLVHPEKGFCSSNEEATINPETTIDDVNVQEYEEINNKFTFD